MDKSDLRIEQLQQYLDKKKGVVESDIKEYNQQLGKNYYCCPLKLFEPKN